LEFDLFGCWWLWALLIHLGRLLLSSQGSRRLICFFCFCDWETGRSKRLVDQADFEDTRF
jgi:hypothetical protein